MKYLASSKALLEWQKKHVRPNHRAICCLYGSEPSNRDWINAFLRFIPPNQVLLGPKQGDRAYLGQSYPFITFNTTKGFHPDYFCAMIDCLRGGGLFFLLIPSNPNLWAESDDPEWEKFAPYQTEKPNPLFLRRLLRWLSKPNDFICWINSLTAIVNEAAQTRDTHRNIRTMVKPSKQQANFIQSVKMLITREIYTISLTANRGRGKSYSIGLLIAEVFTQSNQTRQWALCTPKKIQSIEILNLASDKLNIEQKENEKLRSGQSTVEWFSIEALLVQNPEQFELVIIDEAANFSVNRLKQIIQIFPRIIFSTTVIGYEGSGQGFTLKFSDILKQDCKYLKEVQFHEPLRWGTKDPVEHWVNQVFLFNDIIVNDKAIPKKNTQNLRYLPTPPTYSIEKIKISHLSKNEYQLMGIYTLLRTAHYRTRPSDLRILLDAPGQHLWAYCLEDKCIGVIWVCQDGPINASLHKQISQGKRRLKGHLIPQLLAYQLNNTSYLNKVTARVVRIAVSNNSRRLGIGSQLIKEVERFVLENNWDAIGTSFSEEKAIVSFWFKLGFTSVYTGHRKQTASGKASCVFVKAIKEPDESEQT